MKKTLIGFLILLVFTGTAFYFGWTSFSVPLGDYAVLTSKTSGVSGQVITNGRFSWHWERLLPTNTRLTVFSANPRTVALSNEGTLPSGELYGTVAGGKPNFTWKIGGTISVQINPDLLPRLVRQGIADQGALDSWIDARILGLADSAFRSALSQAISGEFSENGSISDPTLLAQSIKNGILNDAGDDFISTEIQISTVTMPDTDLYRLAKQTYLAYLDEKTRQFSEAAVKQAGSSVSDQYMIDRFEKWGELFTKYPVLVDFIALSQGNAEAALKKLDETP